MAATTTTTATTTLTAAHLDFKAHKDGKDPDTHMKVTLTESSGIQVASVDMTGVGIGDDENKPIDMKASTAPFSAQDALSGKLNIVFEPVGDDTFHFDLDCEFDFSDDTALSYSFQDLTLSENPGNKSMSLALNKPIGS